MFIIKQLRFTLALVTLVVLLLSSSVALAQSPTDWSFSLLPGSGTINGNPGSTIGWGYEISNLSSTNWLFVTDIQASGPFPNCTVNSTHFDYPILAPLTTVSVGYTGQSGLAELTWNKNAPAGFSNAGTFALNADFYDGDPFNGGNYIGGAGIQNAAYRANVSPAAVPEASTAVGFAVELLALLLAAAYCQWKLRATS